MDLDATTDARVELLVEALKGARKRDICDKHKVNDLADGGCWFCLLGVHKREQNEIGRRAGLREAVEIVKRQHGLGVLSVMQMSALVTKAIEKEPNQ